MFDVLVSDDANVTLFVCGDGPLASILRARSDVSFVGESVSSFDFDSISPGRIYSFGWREENEMREVIARSEYALLPSRFVETFGLAALECLRLGVPVIGPRLGGLAAFIPESLAIDLNDPIRLSVDRIREIIRGQIGRDEVSASWRAEIVAHHSRKAWLSTVAHHVLGRRDGRILLVSDYDAPIG
ncbi:MAG TPA: glycosyltransferase [bacterium]|nr:glycosyltransferase [bacterium]